MGRHLEKGFLGGRKGEQSSEGKRMGDDTSKIAGVKIYIFFWVPTPYPTWSMLEFWPSGF